MSIAPSSIKESMAQLKCCVIIPTYDNHKTLPRVLDGVLAYTQNIIVVNDGSTDSTSEILKSYQQIEVLHFEKNKGKGIALRNGFKKAMELGFTFAITIDSDGQHFPDDIPVFINALEIEKTKNVLFIGARNMGHSDVPKKSSFGNKFSNFWFWFETGKWLNDTQCGYRLYPLENLNHLNFYTSKFEFEIEVIVKAAWSGTNVKNIPVKVLYDESERVSHFRPFVDFTRISILNTWLVLVTLFISNPVIYSEDLKKKDLNVFSTRTFCIMTIPQKKRLFPLLWACL